MRLSFSESDTEYTPQLDPAMTRAAYSHIAEQERPRGWEDPDKTRLVPVAHTRFSNPSARTGSSALEDPAAPTEGKDKQTFLDLNPPQIVGGALASATAAVVGAQLGVAGTVAGAALTSMVIAVGGAAYTTSLSRTGYRLGAVASRVRLGGITPPPGEVPNIAEHGVTEFGAATSAATVAGATTAGSTTSVVEHSGGGESPGKRSWRDRFSPVHLLATAAAVFLLAAVVVTGLEALRGESFSGNGQTTVGQIGRQADGGSTADGSGSTDSTDRDTDRVPPRDEATAPATTPAPGTSPGTPAPTSRATSSPAPTSAADSNPGADTRTGTGSRPEAPDSTSGETGTSGTSGSSGRSSGGSGSDGGTPTAAE